VHPVLYYRGAKASRLVQGKIFVACDAQVNGDEVRSNVELKVSERLTFGTVLFERFYAKMNFIIIW
jgi:hypothetical protein